MKVFLVLLAILPAMMAAPEKKFILDSFSGIIDTATLQKDLQIMLDTIGSDPTEQACEQECVLLTHGNLIEHSCPLLCHSFQSLVHHYNIVPLTTTMTSA